MNHEHPSLHAAVAVQAWHVVRQGGVVDAALHESLHHQVTLALDCIRRARPGRVRGTGTRGRLAACIDALGGDAALSALAAPWLADHAGAGVDGGHELVPLSQDELDAIQRALGPLDEPSGWTGTDDADGIEPGLGWHLRRATGPELHDAIDAALARAARVAFDRHRAAGRIAPCWSLASELNAFGGAASRALASDLMRWLDAVRVLDHGALARVLLDEWRAASTLADDASAWAWAGGGPGQADALAAAIAMHADGDRHAATHAALLALIGNPLAPQAEVDAALAAHAPVVDAAIDAALHARARVQGRWRRGRLAWGAAKIAAGLLVVGLGVSWLVRERQLDAQAESLAAQVDAATAAGFGRAEFTDALALIDTAASRGLAARAPMLAAGARLRERMDARRALEDEARAALVAAGSPTAPDAPVESVRRMLDGESSDAHRRQVEAWLAEAARAGVAREEARRAALAERVTAIEAQVAAAEAALGSGGDARALMTTARASLDAMAADASLPAARAEAAASFTSRLDGLAARIDAEDAAARERAARTAELERIAALVTDPVAYGNALRGFAAARSADPLTAAFREAALLEPSWRTAVAWRTLAAELASDALPESLAASRSQRARIEAWLRDHPSGPGVDAARRYLALLPKEHDWSPGTAARVRDLRLDGLALLVLRDGTRQWHRRPLAPVVEQGGRLAIQAIDSVNQPKPAERTIDVADIVVEASRPLDVLLAPLGQRLAVGADHGPAAALSLMHDLVSVRQPASEPAIDPVLRLYLCRAVGLRAQQSLPALVSFLRPTLEAIEREGVDGADWMAPVPRPESAPAWIRAEALAASIAKLDLPAQWRAARAKSAALLSSTPQPVAMLCWDAPGGVITPSADPARAGWSVVLLRGTGDGMMDAVGTINRDGRVELVRPDRIKDRPSGVVLFAVAPAR